MISTLGRKCTNVQNVEIHLVENLHLLSHSGDKPHQCNERGKSFIKVGELKKHLRIYSLEKCTTAQNAITQVAITIISSDTKPNIQWQLTSCWCCFIRVNYVNYKYFEYECGQDLESESLSRFRNWCLVQSFRLKIVNILKLNNIRIIIIKLEFG